MCIRLLRIVMYTNDYIFFFSLFFFYIPLPVYLLSNITLTHKSGKKGETREKKNIYIY